MRREIEGIKVKLSEVGKEDAQAMINLRNNPALNRFLSSSEPVALEFQEQWIEKNKLKKDNVNFKITDKQNVFFGIISLYDIKDLRGQFGRYICTNPVFAIEAEYLLLKYAFDKELLNAVYCRTQEANKSVWRQHYKFGFKDLEIEENEKLNRRYVVQQITKAEFNQFDYSGILELVANF